jgi:hypothetical protein
MGSAINTVAVVVVGMSIGLLAGTYINQRPSMIVYPPAAPDCPVIQRPPAKELEACEEDMDVCVHHLYDCRESDWHYQEALRMCRAGRALDASQCSPKTK